MGVAYRGKMVKVGMTKYYLSFYPSIELIEIESYKILFINFFEFCFFSDDKHALSIYYTHK